MSSSVKVVCGFSYMGRASIRSLVEMAKAGFYAVAKGNKVGVYRSWEDCKLQVYGYPKAEFKKFNSQLQAEDYLRARGIEQWAEMKSSVINERAAGTSKPVPFIDFWPEDICLGEEDDILLVTAANRVDPSASGSKQPPPPHCHLNGSTQIPRKKSEVYAPTEHQVFGNSLFPVDSEGYVLAYTDGSCEGNGSKNAIAGLGVYFDENHPLNACHPVSGRATNNIGEIQAACEAIRIAKECKINKLCINTDSQFVINAITKWLPTWKRKNWKLSDGSNVKNKPDFQILDGLVQNSGISVKWNYVKGHAGIKGNEEADKLARKGAQLYSVSNKKAKLF